MEMPVNPRLFNIQVISDGRVIALIAIERFFPAVVVPEYERST